ncbi:MAG: ABC transporter substrate-binding protein [Pseudomonadota bacterium]
MRGNLVAMVASCAVSLGFVPITLAGPDDDTVRIAAPWDISALTPSAGTALQRMGVTETLTRPGPDGEIAGLLATDWSASEDLTEWRFTIRDDVVFHDGTALTADVAAANLSTFRAENALRDAPISGIRAEGDQVVIQLERPFSPVPAYLSDWSTGIVAAANLEDDAVLTPFGTGYYRVEDVSDPNVMRLVINEDYWGDLPNISRAEYHFVPDVQARQAMIAAGEIEFAFGLPANAVQLLGGADNLSVDVQSLPRIRALKLNAAMPPYDELDVRRAISLAIDRRGIAGAIVGNPEAAATQLIPPTLAGWHDTALAPFEYDPQQAVALLQGAGWARGDDGVLVRDGERFEMELRTYDSRPELPLIGVAVQEMLRDIGIDVSIRQGDWSVISDGHADGSLEAGIISDTFVYVPDPIGAMAENFYQDGGDWGSMNWHNADFDALVEAYQRTADSGALGDMRRQMIEMIHAEMPLITITWYDEVYAVSDAIDGFEFDVYELRYGLDRLTWTE